MDELLAALFPAGTSASTSTSTLTTSIPNEPCAPPPALSLIDVSEPGPVSPFHSLLHSLSARPDTVVVCDVSTLGRPGFSFPLLFDGFEGSGAGFFSLKDWVEGQLGPYLAGLEAHAVVKNVVIDVTPWLEHTPAHAAPLVFTLRDRFLPRGCRMAIAVSGCAEVPALNALRAMATDMLLFGPVVSGYSEKVDGVVTINPHDPLKRKPQRLFTITKDTLTLKDALTI
jgi:hypothetical protein